MNANDVKSDNGVKNESKNQNIEPVKRAVVFKNKYCKADLSEIEAMCVANGFGKPHVIYNCTLNDISPYKEIIKHVIDQPTPPAVIIDLDTYMFPQCIISTSVLGTLEEMQLAEIYIYDRKKSTDDKYSDVSYVELNDQKLTLIKKPTFNALTNAIYQLREIESMCKQRYQKWKKAREGVVMATYINMQVADESGIDSGSIGLSVTGAECKAMKSRGRGGRGYE